MIPTIGSQPSGRAQPKVAEHSHDGEQRQQVKTILDKRRVGGFSLVRRFLLCRIFLQWLPNGKFDIAEKFENLDLESVHADSERTAATAVSMNPLAVFFPVVVLQGFEQMKKIGKH